MRQFFGCQFVTARSAAAAHRVPLSGAASPPEGLMIAASIKSFVWPCARWQQILCLFCLFVGPGGHLDCNGCGIGVAVIRIKTRNQGVGGIGATVSASGYLACIAARVTESAPIPRHVTVQDRIFNSPSPRNSRINGI